MIEGNDCAHLLQKIAQPVARLGCPGRPVGDGDRPFRHEGRGEEGRRIRQVGLDGAVDGINGLRADMPCIRLGSRDGDAVLGQHRYRHVDVGLTRH